MNTAAQTSVEVDDLLAELVNTTREFVKARDPYCKPVATVEIGRQLDTWVKAQGSILDLMYEDGFIPFWLGLGRNFVLFERFLRRKYGDEFFGEEAQVVVEQIRRFLERSRPTWDCFHGGYPGFWDVTSFIEFVDPGLQNRIAFKQVLSRFVRQLGLVRIVEEDVDPESKDRLSALKILQVATELDIIGIQYPPPRSSS